MTPAYARIIARERGQFDDFIRHPGQEFALVLSGACASSSKPVKP